MRVLFLLLLVGCSAEKAQKQPKQPMSASEIGVANCASCGMLVREQAAPRGQLLHRDGTRAFFCSVGDLLIYRNSPSPHGRAIATFVETLDPEQDPSEVAREARPWLSIQKASYVIGIERSGIMGKPVLCYRTAEDANAIAHQFGGQKVSLEELQEVTK